MTPNPQLHRTRKQPRARELNRWAARMSMSSERHHPLTFPRKRHGCRRVWVASLRAVQRGAAARSDSTGLPQARLRRSGQWPNDSLVPTPVTNAPSLSVSSGAACLKRWA